MSTAAEMSIRSRVWSDLHRAHLKASAAATAEVAASALILGPISDKIFGVPLSTRTAVQGALKADGATIIRLSSSGDLGISANNGTFPHDRWMGIARTVRADIAAQLHLLGEALPSWDRAWDEIVAPTAKAVATGVQQAASVAPYVLVLVVVALVAIAVIKVT